jgi:hypothetical protein
VRPKGYLEALYIEGCGFNRQMKKKKNEDNYTFSIGGSGCPSQSPMEESKQET